MIRPEHLFREWRDAIRQEWGPGPQLDCLDELRELFASIVTSPRRSREWFGEFGRKCAEAGVTVEDTLAWSTSLVNRAPRVVRRLLDQRDLAFAVVDGWASTTMRPLVHLGGRASMRVLAIRLEQQYDRCEAIGVAPNEAHAVVVLTISDSSARSANRGRLLEAMAAEARRHFRRGETIAQTPGGRLLILTDRTPDLTDDVRRMVARLNELPAAAGSLVRGWVEPLASDRVHLSAHLDDLAGCAN